MEQSKYMRIHIRLIPPEIISHNNSNGLVYQYGWIYMEIIRVMYGLPQVEILANNLIAQRLSNHEYYQVKKTPGLWKHV